MSDLIVAANCFGEGVRQIGLAGELGRVILAAPGLLLPLAALVTLTFAWVCGSGMAATQSLFEYFAAPALQLELEVDVVRRLIDELPEGPEKDTVRLFYVEGELSAREIAERLGVGKSAVTMRLERFRAKVRRELMLAVLKRRWTP